MTNIRNTAFRLTLEDAPELGQEPGIHAFATNGLTSTEMLRATYLRLIGGRQLPKGPGQKIELGSCSLETRVSLEDE